MLAYLLVKLRGLDGKGHSNNLESRSEILEPMRCEIFLLKLL